MTDRADDQIAIQLNGRDARIPHDSSVSDLLAVRGLNPLLVAVEINGEIVARASFPGRRLESGDEVEVVHFVGGGKSFPR